MQKMYPKYSVKGRGLLITRMACSFDRDSGLRELSWSANAMFMNFCVSNN